MAPSSERDQDVKTKEETPSAPKENPFIKFRQFADTHIGTLLQGIIGLPSALKNTSGNTRWADFDDDLRRRDDLQAKQRQLKEEDTRSEEDEDEDEKTTAESQLNEYTSPNSEKESMAEYFPLNVKEGKDIPLFSPVTKALFEHLHTEDSTSNWGIHPLASLGDAFRIEYFPFQVLQNQKPSDDMEAVQFMAYNELNRSNILQSDYSLLPYLLFSPYSPIRLKLEAAKCVSTATKVFPYDAAFEDLIRTTEESRYSPTLQDYQMHKEIIQREKEGFGMTVSNDETDNQPDRNRFRPFNLNRFYGNPSVGWMAWVHNLYGENLLQQREVREVPAHLFTSWSGASLKLPLSRSDKITENDDDEDENEDEDTELDMYQRFLHWASTPGGIVGALDALCTNPEGFLEKQLKVLESPEGKKVVEELLESKFAKEVKDLVDMLEGFDRQDAQSQKSPTTPIKVAHDSGKIVSSSTTTEHTTHEDGSVETCVTVWKRYADGRESVTTTNHVDNPACDENGNQIASPSTEERASVDEEKKAEKKGWFWS